MEFCKKDSTTDLRCDTTMPPVYNVPRMKLWHRRSLLEQILLVLFAVAMIVIIALSITVGVRNKNGWGCAEVQEAAARDVSTVTPSDGSRVPVKNETSDGDRYCTSDECLISAAEIISSREASLDPCDDFYDYSCQGWIRNSVLIGDGRLGLKELAEQKIILRIKELLEEDVTDDVVPEHFDKARNYYSTCTDWVDRELEGVSKLLSDIAYFGGYPALLGEQWNASTFNYVTSLARMWERGFDIRFLINVDLRPDPRNTTKLIITLGQLDTSTLTSTRLGQSQLLDLYAEYSAIFLRNLCQQEQNSSTCPTRNGADLTLELKQAIQVETDIAANFGPKVTFESYSSSKNIMKLGDLLSLFKEVDLLALIRFHFPNPRAVSGTDEILLTTSLESIKNVSRYLAGLDSSDQGRTSLANYMMWRLVLQAAPDLNQRMMISLVDLQAYLGGQLKIPELWTLCLQETIRIFRVSVAASYVNEFHSNFPTRQKPVIQKMISKIRTMLKTIINETGWMDDMTKREAQYKLEKLYVTTGYPDGLLSESKANTYYKKLKVGDNHYENVRNANSFLGSKVFGRFGKAADRSDWDAFPNDLLSPESTSYLAMNNSAYISIGIIQALYINDRNPSYINYGRLGTLIGNLFAQALDSQGSLFDSNGNLRKWWRDETQVKFEASSLCMVKLFDDYFIPDFNMSLNGQKLFLKNTAQQLGIVESYRAFVQELTNGQSSATLPGIDCDEKQLFWVAYATSVCEKVSFNFIQQEVAQGEETPAKYRVNALLSNNKNFIQDFNCILGSKMNVDDAKCHVWAQ